MMFRAGFAYARSLVEDVDDITLAFAYATAAWERQRATTRSYGADMRFFYNVWGTPDTWNVHVTGHYAWHLYNRAFDPLGAIELSLSAGLNNQHGARFEDGGIACSALIGGAYARYFSRGTRIVASLRGGIENGGGLVMLAVEGRFGVARGAFVEAK